MIESQAVLIFAALAQETRLKIVRALVPFGTVGLAAGQLADRVGVSRSNLSFHLKELERAGLLNARRQGTSIYYAASFEALANLVEFLSQNCCSEVPCQDLGRDCP